MGFLIEIVIRMFISVLNQFTKADLNHFIEQFPKEVGEKIGQATKGNLEPIKKWLSDNTSNLSFFISALGKKKISTELSLPDKNLDEIENLINAVLDAINSIKKPLILREIFGNIHYFSLGEIDGYITNAYSKNGFSIKLNTHFRIILIDSQKSNYDKLLKLISNSQPLPKRMIKKSWRVTEIRPNEIELEKGKWIIRKRILPINFSIDSYLNLLADIDQNIQQASNKKSLWKSILKYIGV